MKLTFLGAVGTVTGSKYLLEDGGKKFLIDCGLFQGAKEWRLKNWDKFPVDPASIDAIVLTHAHLDHSGYLPRLIKEGFKGPIFCSEATLDLCKILLPDSGLIQEEDATRANRYNYSKHAPALPLYTAAEAVEALRQFKPVSWAQSHALSEYLQFSLHRAGHILGAAMVRIDDGNTSITFSGDIGRFNDPIMKAPTDVEKTDYLIVESTYGDRLHERTDPAAELDDIIQRTLKRGGSIVIPAFAVGRAQTMMYYIHLLKDSGRIPASVPIYLDSPMAINASDLLLKYQNDHKLPAALCRDICNTTTYVRTTAESKALNQEGLPMPKIVISASGMATGGRVLHHLKYMAGNPKNSIILAGYQAEGTRGARLAKGEKEIKIHGQLWPVRAEVVQLHNMSAHADYSEILSWMRRFKSAPKKTFITHGEPSAAATFCRKIKENLDWNVSIPSYLTAEDL